MAPQSQDIRSRRRRITERTEDNEELATRSEQVHGDALSLLERHLTESLLLLRFD